MAKVKITHVRSSEEYVERNGLVCPACDSESIEAGSIEVEGSAGWCNVFCHDCGSEWVDEFLLTGYDHFDIGEGVEITKE
jgi:transposase-like protein